MGENRTCGCVQRAEPSEKEEKSSVSARRSGAPTVPTMRWAVSRGVAHSEEWAMERGEDSNVVLVESDLGMISIC